MVYTFFKIPVFSICISFGITFAWVIGINVGIVHVKNQIAIDRLYCFRRLYRFSWYLRLP